MVAMASSNMTDSGSSASLALSPSASDICPPILITVADEAPRLPGRLVHAVHVQGSPLAREEQSGQLQQALWNAAGAGEHSPQPQPAGCACMRTEHAPQRQPAACDRAESPDEQDGQRHDLPHVPALHEGQEHPPETRAAARAPMLLLLLTLCAVRAGEVGEAPPTKLPAGTKKASACLTTRARTAAPSTATHFMVFRSKGLDSALWLSFDAAVVCLEVAGMLGTKKKGPRRCVSIPPPHS